MFAHQCRAQGLGDPIVQITFGSGFNQYAGALQPDSGFTSYNPVTRSPEDNEYAIANSTAGMNRAWVLTTDHTGDPNGYMMVVNAAYTPGLFYTRRVTGLCGGSTYEFSAWIKNIILRGGILPNITFRIEDVNGNLLFQDGTGDIDPVDRWQEYAYVFQTSPNMTDVVLKMINNAPGGSGNDLAIDDIVFRAIGAPVGIRFVQTKNYACEGRSETLNLTTTGPLPPNYMSRFQRRTNNGWEDIRPAGTDTSIVINTPTAPGTYFYRMVIADAGNINSRACVVSSNVLSLTVYQLPVAIIQAPDNACEGEATQFKDLSVAQGTSITSWLWDFGDGSPTSNEKDPVHVYTRPGTFPVKLTVTTAAGCSATAIKSPGVQVVTVAKADFTTSSALCETRAVTFTDKSSSVNSIITSRTWDFDDGSPAVTKTDGSPFDHTFAEAKTYNVKLTLSTDKGCSVSKTVALKVSQLPDVNFTLPEVCYADYYATFKDSTFLAGSSAGFTYLWNFGDSDATAANPNTSTLKNPQHHYSRIDKYTITLTVTTADGCSATKTKTFQVNGSPQPKFIVRNEPALCANNEVFFENQSTATAGNVTKLIIYYNTADRTIAEVDENPYPGKLYRHSYAAGTYNIEMVAFTGEANVCQEVSTKAITILPAPALAFTPPGAVCLNNGPVKLTYTESTGIAGTPVFSGRGVTGDIFNPEAAGIGTWPVRMIYTTGQATGCADTIVQNITVKPIPMLVNAGPDVSILAGNSARINATASGNALKYLWTPSIGLSSDTVLNPIVSLSNENVTYKLKVTIADGSAAPACSVEDSITVFVLKVPVIPNTFTPNGDGINDTWEIRNLQPYEGSMITVYNRYGQKVYTSIGYSIPWDGRMNGRSLPAGVYYYIIDPKHGLKQVSGYITIVR